MKAVRNMKTKRYILYGREPEQGQGLDELVMAFRRLNAYILINTCLSFTQRRLNQVC